MSKLFAIRVPEELIVAIERHPDYREPAPGRAGGVGEWLKRAAWEKLGLEEPRDYHEERSDYWKKKSRKKT